MEKLFYWECESNDGYHELSETKFRTRKECYDNMRGAVLSKMTWNTNYQEDFDMTEEELDKLPINHDFMGKEGCIAYEVMFSPNQIIHSSYSGIYTYTMKEVLPCPDFDNIDLSFNLMQEADAYEIVPKGCELRIGVVYMNGYIEINNTMSSQYKKYVASPFVMQKIVNFANNLVLNCVFD